VSGVGAGEDDGAGGPDLWSPTGMHGGRRQEPDAGVAVLLVVPAEEPLAEGPGVLERAEPVGKPGRYLSVLNWASLYGLMLL